MAYIKPNKSLSPAWLKVKPGREGFEQFKERLAALVAHINSSPNESEEHHKNHISDFLKYTFRFPAYFINTKYRNDLVICNGKSVKDAVGIIIETKRPTNQAEMPTLTNLNVKAMQELVLYYLRERITAKNLAVRHLIICNGYEWFVFDAHIFEKAFAQNKLLVKQFNDFDAGRLAGNTTDFFYKEIAKPAIEKMGEVEFTHFDLRDKRSDKQTIALFKLFSPEHLLKLPFANDSNSLNKDFYSELLHIIGLVEVKDGSKKLIQRKKEGERNRASLLENAISKMDALDKLRNFEKPTLYGDTTQEQLFNVGLELAITWVNRVLFLKLLEAQLKAYHKDGESYAFLNIQRIRTFDDLDALFFEVLARKPAEREAEIQKTFAKVPYLNSSLFETTEIERKVLNIGNLSGEITLPIFGSTVLKDGKEKRRTGELNTLEYLFAFLAAYDFASEGADELKDDNKALINASVLGLIFEKINGYKDGSFFTPGFITMYMCRETLRRAVVQKFNEVKRWACNDITELYNQIEDRAEANTIINSLKICDPAVGSGHFLVSALNELIAIKAELGVLQDAEGKRLKNYSVEIINDELLVLDEEGDEFSYNPSNSESARIQKTLFNEKQVLIENCLFGVDINPNSVKICRLRLWIELLKNAYYNADGQLETLPNIDINIKVGNSLISRFALDADLKDALKKSKRTLADYRNAVDTYRNAGSKEQKREMECLIAEIKNDFRTEILCHDPKAKKLENMRAEIKLLELPQTLLEESAKEKKERKQRREKLKLQFDKLSAEIEEIKNNKIYENAFEWRFEFPEALDDAGAFVGFDVVIGNPPYIGIRSQEELAKQYLNKHYLYSKGADIYVAFIERAAMLLKRRGYLAYIVPNKFFGADYGKAIRRYLQYGELEISSIWDLKDEKIFDEAQISTISISFRKERTGTNPILIQGDSSAPFSNIFDDDGKIQIESHGEEKSLIQKLNVHPRLDSIADVRTGVMGFEYWRMSEIVKDAPPAKGFVKLYTNGNFSRYRDGWGVQEVALYKSKFTQPLMELNSQYLNKNTVSLFEQAPKLIVRGVSKRLAGIVDLEGAGLLVAVHSIIPASASWQFVLALINSTLLNWYHLNTQYSVRIPQGSLKYPISFFKSLPIPSQDEQPELVAKLERLVNQICAFRKQNPSADTSELDNEIDQLVYALYGLTPEEIALVEGDKAQEPH